MPVKSKVPPLEKLYHLMVFAPLVGVAEINVEPAWHTVEPDTEVGADGEPRVTVTGVREELWQPPEVALAA